MFSDELREIERRRSDHEGMGFEKVRNVPSMPIAAPRREMAMVENFILND